MNGYMLGYILIYGSVVIIIPMRLFFKRERERKRRERELPIFR